MVTHSHILAWEISQTEESGGLQSVGLQNQTQPSDEIINNSNTNKNRMEELSPKHLVPTSQFTEKFSRRIAFYHEENGDRVW